MNVGIITCVRQLGKFLATRQVFGNQASYWQLRLREFRWHLAVMERGERSCACVVVCDPGDKNDDSAVSITNTGCIRCDN